MPILWEIDPTSEVATNTPLSLVGIVNSVTWRLTDMDLTPPDTDPVYAASADTEGDPFVGSRRRNRVIALTFIGTAATDVQIQSGVYIIEQKLEKLRNEGGTLKFTTMAATELVGDVNYARFKPEFTKEMYGHLKAIKFTIEFECRPYFRGAPVPQSDHVETTLPVLTFVDTNLAGDVPGLGRLIIDEDQAQDQWWVVWGVQSRYYDGASSAALFYEAESRVGLGGSAPAAGPSGASGAGSNVMRNTALTTKYQAVITSQAASGSAHWSHVGTFRLFARVQVPSTSTGVVDVALQWSQGDGQRFTRNATVHLVTIVPSGQRFGRGVWQIADLGLVTLTPVASGTQRWEARILAKSTVAGDGLDMDYFFLVPADEGSGEVAVVPQLQTASLFGGRDEFDQTAGALNAKVAPIGGTWATSGGGADFSVNATAHTLERTTTDNTQRWAILGATTYTLCGITADVMWTGTTLATGIPVSGVIARWVDSSNYLVGFVSVRSGGQLYVSIQKVVAGVADSIVLRDSAAMTLGEWHTLSMQVDAGGRAMLWLGFQGQLVSTPTLIAQDPVLATGGALASGKAGLWDIGSNATSGTRSYDNLGVWTPAPNAAMFASQSLEVRSDRVLREDSTGTMLVDADHEGDHLFVSPAGREGRSARFIVKASRNPQGVMMPDPAIDDISARLTYTPRYLVLGP